MKIVFFAGKGGVGKSTNSSLFAYKTAGLGKRVLLNSIDPAHNLHDIFERKFSRKPVEVIPNLMVMETDLGRWVKKYLKETEESFKSVYKYQEAFNLHKYFRTLKYSPGMEEYAVILAIKDTISRYSDFDYIVFDTPPTALTLKFFALPKVNLLWLQELKKFREMILQKKEIISKITSGHKAGKVTDKIMDKLDSMITENTNLLGMFQDRDRCSVKLVLNPDRLSLAESEDILEELNNLEINLSSVIVNKCEDPDIFSSKIKKSLRDKSFDHVRLIFTPTQCREVTGSEMLEDFQVPEGYLDLA